MAKKLIIIILSLFLIIFCGFLTLNAMQDNIKVGDVYFNVPEGYHEIGHTNGIMNITDGENTIYIRAYDDGNVQSHIDNYITKKNTRNSKTIIDNLTIGDFFVYKSSNLNYTDIHHYWFVKDDKTYDISSWGGSGDSDSIIMGLIESMN